MFEVSFLSIYYSASINVITTITLITYAYFNPRCTTGLPAPIFIIDRKRHISIYQTLSRGIFHSTPLKKEASIVHPIPLAKIWSRNPPKCILLLDCYY